MYNTLPVIEIQLYNGGTTPYTGLGAGWYYYFAITIGTDPTQTPLVRVYDADIDLNPESLDVGVLRFQANCTTSQFAAAVTGNNLDSPVYCQAELQIDTSPASSSAKPEVILPFWLQAYNIADDRTASDPS